MNGFRLFAFDAPIFFDLFIDSTFVVLGFINFDRLFLQIFHLLHRNRFPCLRDDTVHTFLSLLSEELLCFWLSLELSLVDWATLVLCVLDYKLFVSSTRTFTNVPECFHFCALLCGLPTTSCRLILFSCPSVCLCGTKDIAFRLCSSL